MTKVREFATRWVNPAERIWFERDKETLIGSARNSPRNTPKFRPFDMLREPNESLMLWENDDMRIGVESVVGSAPFFRRNADFDELFFQFAGRTDVETEYGRFATKPGELLLIPGGIAHRSAGTADSLRLFIRLQEPVKPLLTEQNHASRTEFDVVRRGGPAWGAAEGAPSASNGKVMERMLFWEAAEEEYTEIERDYERLIGCASDGRGMQKLRAFDFFNRVTGRQGPGPKIYESSVFHTEAYNTVGEQFAFHRGLDDDELWLQFRGDSVNESEFGVYNLTPGEMNHIPPGIAHRVVGGEGFLRIVFYSHKPWKLMINPTRHHFESTFDIRARVVESAPSKTTASGQP
jgi:quercetin dioxygenase-like cupin family protein